MTSLHDAGNTAAIALHIDGFRQQQ
jgi:hypothetical protein